jgi:hypothetical protein
MLRQDRAVHADAFQMPRRMVVAKFRRHDQAVKRFQVCRENVAILLFHRL